MTEGSPLAIVHHHDAQAEYPATSFIEFNRAAVANALSPELAQAISKGLEEAAALGQKLVVLQGLGRHFCAGFDFSDLEGQDDDSLRARFLAIEALLQSVASAPFLTVAAIEGAAFGAGADLAVACRLRWGTERAKFKFPGSRFGLVLGSRRLAHCVGAARSITILANNETVLAEQALSDGLLTEIMLDTDAMNSRIAALASNLQSLSQTTLQALLEETNVASQNDLALKALKNSMTAGLKDRIQTFRNSNSQ